MQACPWDLSQEDLAPFKQCSSHLRIQENFKHRGPSWKACDGRSVSTRMMSPRAHPELEQMILQSSDYFFFYNFFIYFWLSWVLIAVRAFLQVRRADATPQLRCVGFSLRWLLLLQSTGLYGLQASVVAARGLSRCGSQALEHKLNSCGARLLQACGIFLIQGSNLYLLGWQADSLVLSHKEAPSPVVLNQQALDHLCQKLMYVKMQIPWLHLGPTRTKFPQREI